MISAETRERLLSEALPVSAVPAKSRKREAYKLLGITADDVRSHPIVTPQLRAIRRILHRRQQYNPQPITLLRSSNEPDARLLVDAYDSIPGGYARYLPLEAFAVAAQLSPLRVLELYTMTAVRAGAQASSVIAAVSHPSVMEKTVESALSDVDEYRHDSRVVLHRITGALPQPKGAQTIINMSQNQNQAQAASSGVAPPPENTIRKFVDRFNTRSRPAAALPPAPEPVTVPAPASAAWGDREREVEYVPTAPRSEGNEEIEEAEFDDDEEE